MMDTILFDLDGTLLPLNMDEFMKLYFGEMGAAFADLIPPKELVSHIWASTNAMVSNTEYKINEDVFMEDFRTRIPHDLEIFKSRFDQFYDAGFLKVQASVQTQPLMQKSVAMLKDKGYTLVIATNPLFPKKAIYHRINWAGLDPEDFCYITYYEQNHYCKPQLQYYEEILQAVDKKPEQCMMVGNDVEEDLVAGKLGIQTYLITDCILDKGESPYTPTYQGTYEDFYHFIESLPAIQK